MRNCDINAAVEAHEARLVRMQEDAESDAMERESKINKAEKKIIEHSTDIEDAFLNHATNEEIDMVYAALAKMYQAYVTGASTEERNGGIIDYFALDIAPIYERVITAAATRKVDGHGH